MSTRPALASRYRFWFLLDGVVTGANALAYLILHQLLSEAFGSAPILYTVAGIILAVVTVGLLVVVFSSRRHRVLPELLAGINLVWALGSLAIAFVNPFHLSVWGIGWVIAQALIVLAFAILQLRALKHPAP